MNEISLLPRKRREKKNLTFNNIRVDLLKDEEQFNRIRFYDVFATFSIK